MLDWAEGVLTHWSEFPTPIDDESQRRTQLACQAADCQEVKKWAIVFTALLREEKL